MAVGTTNPVNAAPRGPQSVATAIQQAARTTGANFEYLLATAKVESGLNPKLSAKTSSARGLFQFIEQTWLGTLKQAGPEHGYARYANAITRTRSGKYVVTDPNLRRQILDLRKDPTANAVMAGVFTRKNASVLSSRLGRPPTEGELYVAHFFGVGGAARLISLAENNPQAKADQLFPGAARANKPIFYDKQGNARSVAGVYAELVRRYDVARAAPGPANTEIAAVRPPAPIPNAAQDTDAITRAYATAAPPPPVPPAPSAVPAPTPVNAPAPVQLRIDDGGPMFLGLFRTPPDAPRTAVAPVVSALWGAPTRVPDAPAPVTPPNELPRIAAPAPGAPLDLFQNMRPNIRGLFDGKV
jgi:hypothetical protein